MGQSLLGIRTVRSTSEESGLVTSSEGEGEEKGRGAEAPLKCHDFNK